VEETMTRRKTLPLVLVTVFLTLVVCAQPGAPGMCSRLSFVAVGDALIHQGVYNAARADDGVFDFSPMLRLVKDRIARHDLAFYNQETILGGVELGLSTYPCFNSPREVGDAFLDTGFNLVSLANNHTLDRQENGVLRSLEYWSEKESVLTAGSYSIQEDRDEIRTVDVNGITCAFLAYTTLTNGLKPPAGKEHYVNVYDPETARADVEKARAIADVVIVSMHWGSEYVFTPTLAQTEIAEHLARLGVHIVVGHHPHVVQPVTMVGDTLVIYSLGNFLSAQKELFKLVGLLVSLDVVKTETPHGVKISLENVTGTLLYNPRRSPLGRYVVVPFDMMTEAILKDYTTVHSRFAAYVKKDDAITIEGPAQVQE
jgi:poly-gamma-glutamate synthesis protein (capsule biosynthesis protein)